MKKISYFVVGLLLLSSFAALGIGKEAVVNRDTIDSNMVQKKTIDLQFLKPTIVEHDSFIELQVKGANARLTHVEKPILPTYVTTMSFPLGTKIVDIKCNTENIKTMVLSRKIAPSPKPVMLGSDRYERENKREKSIYESNGPYPNNWFSYYTGGGLDKNNKRTTFVTLMIYPVIYKPAIDTIDYVEDIELIIEYKEPTANPFSLNSEYDLVIIAPSKFSSTLQNLIDHKNDHGVTTTLKTVEEIYDEYSGADKPEQIKYFIKDAIETWNVTYVLLVGGMKSLIFGAGRDDVNQGSDSWYVPVRYSNLDDGQDKGFICDLYYADIYDGNGNFSDWDSNENGIFGEWRGTKKDVLNLFPDVYVGRLPCRNKIEVKIMVNKIINYENEPIDASWFNKMVVVGGESFDDTGHDWLEGELMCEKALSYMSGFDPVKIYASNWGSGELVPSTEDIVSTVSDGCGILFFSGFGNPLTWTTHWPGDFSWDNAPEGINCYDFPKLFNREKLPVCVISGSHNGMFNVTFLATLDENMRTHGIPIPECWCWWITRKIGGGSIASIGESGMGYGMMGESGDLDGDGVNEPDCVEGLSGYLVTRFFKAYGADGFDILGETWGQAITSFLNTFPGMDDQTDCKTIEQWTLFGDPSLKIGGYAE